MNPVVSDHANFGTWMSRADAAMASNRNIEALECIDKALSIRPRSAEGLNARGTVLDALGRLEDAAAAFQRAAVEDPASPDLHFNVAYALQRQKRFSEALVAYDRVLALSPNSPDALSNRAVTLAELGHPQEATITIQNALRLLPNDSRVLKSLGYIQSQGLNFEAAHQTFDAVLRLRPGDLDARVSFARCLLALEKFDDAIQNFELVLDLSPDHQAAVEGLAKAYRSLERYEELLTVCRKLTRLAPAAAGAWVELGAVMATLNQSAEVKTCFHKALEIDPRNAQLHARFGWALMELGELEQARACFRLACELDPRSASYWRCLVGLAKVDSKDAVFDTLEKLLPTSNPADRVEIHFALGKAFRDVGDKDRSFSHFLKGNKEARKRVRYDEPVTLEKLATIARRFSEAVVRRCEGGGDASRVPIFILGMPRTGSTLVEQILSVNEHVLALGELSAFGRAVGAVGKKRSPTFSDWLSVFDANDASALGVDYLAHILKLARLRDPAFDPSRGARVIDKMPSNFYHAGLIHLSLPNARIIHTRRDPIDTCLSCFENQLAEWPSGHDLAELGRYYRHYVEVMKTWSATLPKGTILDVDYKLLVTDFENQVRRIVSYCNLQWDSAYLSFNKVARPVRTASAAQVRQPLFSTSVRKWRPSDEILRPLLDALMESPKSTA